MKRGEIAVLVAVGLLVLISVVLNVVRSERNQEPDLGIPYYSTAAANVASGAMDVYREQGCKGCHSLWTVRNMLESIPAPKLDGIGSIRTEEWLYNYFSAENPQAMLPSRLKQEFRMPSYAKLPEKDRRLLASYMASLKVKDWYLQDTRKEEYEKLTGKDYKP
jgi:cbb3-type cytochrome oxidase cytochrome c subunit